VTRVTRSCAAPLAFASSFFYHCAITTSATPAGTFAPVRAPFRALATTIVPEAGALDERAWEDVEAAIEQGLASRPESIKRQLRILVRALNLLPLFRFGRTFQSLDPAARTAFLLKIQNAPLLLLRRGFWGLRTLVFMGYYGREEARDAIGYRAGARGWELRR
jgi:hypothetical protein